MRNFRALFFAFAATTLVFTACSPVNRVTKRLSGDWEITNYEERKLDKPGFASTYIGTLTLNPDQTGTRRLSYDSWGAAVNDTTSFTWVNTENIVTIKSQGDEETKTWIIIALKRHKLKWKSTDGAGNVQVMMMKRLK
ncbi:MAG: lipocalin family protein [Bacteroidales bacterium]|nr:lipocalin family protein [Bacteroidales bacterium]MDZ4205260.1 lipocalin family protein [Bacteroidales bacterium]